MFGFLKNNKMLGSRKFLLGILTALLVALNDSLGWGLSEETIQNILIAVGLPIGGEALADMVGAFKGGKK